MSFAGAPDILYVPLPAPPTLSRWPLFRMLTGFLIASLWAPLVIAVLRLRLHSAWYGAAALAPVLLAVACLVLAIAHESLGRWRYRRLGAMDSSDDLATATARFLLNRDVGRHPSRLGLIWNGFEQERIRRGIPPLKIVVDEALRVPLAASLTDHLLEPEQVLPVRATGVQGLVATTATGAFAVWFFYRGSALWGGITAALFLLWLLRYPAVLAAAPILGDRLPVAGPGYLELRAGGRMTVKDSVMIVARGPRRHSVQVWLTGPLGTLGWLYRRPDDPRFVALWQRWAHPKPRLDLDTA